MVNAPEGLNIILCTRDSIFLSPRFHKMPCKSGNAAALTYHLLSLSLSPRFHKMSHINVRIMTNRCDCHADWAQQPDWTAAGAAAEKFRINLKKNMVKWPSSPAMVPFVHKVGDGRPPKQGKWQHCQTGPTISIHIANPTLYTGSNLDFLPSGDTLSNILPSTHFKHQRWNL